MTRFTGTDQRIYIKVLGDQAVGFVKVGEENLFYRDHLGTYPTIKGVLNSCILHAFSIFMFIKAAKDPDMARYNNLISLGNI